MDYLELKNNYGTPLYVYDEDIIKTKMLNYQKSFQTIAFPTEIIYASKAFCIKAMLKLVKEANLSLDVVSEGELLTAVAVGFDPQKIYFHGNNKQFLELELAINYGVGYIVVDNVYELNLLKQIAVNYSKKVNILIRLNVDVKADTHAHITTGHTDSKFGTHFKSIDYEKMFEIIDSCSYLSFEGFHCHIGSQIMNLKAYYAEIEALFIVLKNFSQPLILNIGGGFGVAYTDSDEPLPTEVICSSLINKTIELQNRYNVNIKKLCIEPGRSIVAEAGTTLYTIGALKQTPNKLYYFVDGGMTDNIRPALYQAEYQSFIVGKEKEFANKVVTIAGKCCESGDIIISNTLLPLAEVGDLLVVKTTGAYGYSMASNYNKTCIPAVVFTSKKQTRLVVRRQTYAELLGREE